MSNVVASEAVPSALFASTVTVQAGLVASPPVEVSVLHVFVILVPSFILVGSALVRSICTVLTYFGFFCWCCCPLDGEIGTSTSQDTLKLG